MDLFDVIYILGFFAFFGVIVGAAFKAFDINEEKVLKLFKLNEE
ncbi:hypothetical protein [Bacillus xiapuensis]|uniref:Uncharacterized protein n=1 Tax=Bacillus xiapuensis TaxID=2014075 RepID=A0ABU6N8F0_9BACI|nr:hypothetical protein [Bacillus xiapuensis]